MARRAAPVRGSRFARSDRQPTNWSRVVENAQVTIAAVTKVLMHNLVLSNPGIAETVRRTRGVLTVTSDVAAIGEFVSGALGAMVVTDTAVAVGITALPDPVTDKDDDGWMLWVPFQGIVQGVAGTTWANLPPYLTVDFDSKAMRKVEEGFGVVYVVATAAGSNGVELGLTLSVLTSRQ